MPAPPSFPLSLFFLSSQPLAFYNHQSNRKISTPNKPLIFRCSCEWSEYTKFQRSEKSYLRGFIRQTLLSNPYEIARESSRVLFSSDPDSSTTNSSNRVRLPQRSNARAVQTRFSPLLSSTEARTPVTVLLPAIWFDYLPLWFLSH